MIDKIQTVVTAIVLTGLGMAALMIMLKWLIDMGFMWAMVAICAGVLIWKYASESELF